MANRDSPDKDAPNPTLFGRESHADNEVDRESNPCGCEDSYYGDEEDHGNAEEPTNKEDSRGMDRIISCIQGSCLNDTDSCYNRSM